MLISQGIAASGQRLPLASRTSTVTNARSCPSAEITRRSAIRRRRARLPRTFKIPTPVGHYAPDWAIAFHDNMGVKHIFFVAETKGSLQSMDLKGAEKAKIACAKKLFNELSTSKVRYHEVTDYQNMLNEINSLM